MTGVPVRNAQGEGSLVIVNFLGDEHSELNAPCARTPWWPAIALALVTTLGAWRSGRLLAPLRTMRATARDISDTDLTRRIPDTGNDDITDLARTFNAMLDRLEDAFAAQRQFLDDAGHELRTPITVLRGHLELLDPDDSDEIAATRGLVLDEVDRMGRLVDDLIVLAKADRPDFLQLRPADVGALTDEVLDKARGLGEREWKLDERGEGAVLVDPQRVTQALLQLADNAVQHTGRRRRDRDRSAAATGGRALWVRDTGAGVPPEDGERDLRALPARHRRPRRRGLRARALDRRGRSPRRTAARSSPGRRPERGATFDCSPSADRPAEGGRRMNRILIVEDEARIASFVEKGLRANGFTPTVVDDGRDRARPRPVRRLRPDGARHRAAGHGRVHRAATSCAPRAAGSR